MSILPISHSFIILLNSDIIDSVLADATSTKHPQQYNSANENCYTLISSPQSLNLVSTSDESVFD